MVEMSGSLEMLHFLYFPSLVQFERTCVVQRSLCMHFKIGKLLHLSSFNSFLILILLCTWVLARGIHGISCHLTRSSSLFVEIFWLLCKRRICFKISELRLGLCFLMESPCDGTIFWPGLEMSLVSGYSQNPMGEASFSWAAATCFNVRPLCLPGSSILWDIQSSLKSESREPLLARHALFTPWNVLLARLFCRGVESLVWCRVAQSEMKWCKSQVFVERKSGLEKAGECPWISFQMFPL